MPVPSAAKRSSKTIFNTKLYRIIAGMAITRELARNARMVVREKGAMFAGHREGLFGKKDRFAVRLGIIVRKAESGRIDK